MPSQLRACPIALAALASETGLYAAEASYTGSVAPHPDEPGRVFVSTDVHPGTGVPLISRRDRRRHHELFEGVTRDGGTTWSWNAITSDSTGDSLRPIVPSWDSSTTALLWLRGTYTTYTDYDLEVVGRLLTTYDATHAGSTGTRGRADITERAEYRARRGQ